MDYDAQLAKLDYTAPADDAEARAYYKVQAGLLARLEWVGSPRLNRQVRVAFEKGRGRAPETPQEWCEALMVLGRVWGLQGVEAQCRAAQNDAVMERLLARPRPTPRS